MSCTVKTNLIEDLKSKGVIKPGSREILDFGEFTRLNQKYTKYATEKYGLNTHGQMLFDVTDNYKTIGNKGTKKYVMRAEPNNALLNVLNDIVEEYKKDHTGFIESNTLRTLEDKDTGDFLNTAPNVVSQVEVPKGEASKVLLPYENPKLQYSAQELLDNLASNYDVFNKETKEVMDAMMSVARRTDATVRVVPAAVLTDSRDDLNVFMDFDPVTNVIRVSVDLMNKQEAGIVAQSFLHEVIHNLTYNALESPQTVEEEMFQQFMYEAYEQYLALDEEMYEDGSEKYGFTDVHEFAAELMTNPDFQAHVQDLQKWGKSFWRNFIDSIRRFLGLSTVEFRSDYNEVIDAIVKAAKPHENYREEYYTLQYVPNRLAKASQDSKGYYQLDTIEKKLKFMVDGIKDNLEENIRRYDMLIKRVKDSSGIEKYSNKLKELLEEIEESDNVQSWHAITLFINQLEKNIKSLETKFATEDFGDKDVLDTIHLYDKYLKSHSLVEELTKFISDAAIEDNLPISAEELKKLRKSLSISSGKYDTLKADFSAMRKKALVQKLNNRKYATEVLYKWRQKLKKKHRDMNIHENVDSWVNRQMETAYKDEIDKDVEENARKLVNDPDFDISLATHMFNSGINTNSKLVQIMQKLIDQIRAAIVEKTRSQDIRMKQLFDKLIAEKGNVKPSKLYENIIERDADGRAMLKSDYKYEFKETYERLLQEYNAEKKAIEEKFGKGSAEFRMAYANSEFKKWVDANTVTKIDEFGQEETLPSDKWKNDLSTLSEAELDVLTEFRQILKESHARTFGIGSLISRPLFGQQFYSLPSITRTDMERILEGDSKGMVKDKWKDLTSIRIDDVGYETEEKNVDLSGNPIYNVKVNFRGQIEPDQQSIDLFTMMRLEYKNGVNFEEKHKAEMEMTTLVEISKEKAYYRTSGIRIPLIGKHIGRNAKLLIKGRESNTYKRMVSLMESNMYDILHKNAGKIGPVDTNKAVRMLNGWTASVGMTLNEVSAVANVLNGKAQLFLEAVAGDYIKGASIAKAEKIYFQNMKSNMADINSPVKTSYTNQINEMFDTFGLISVSSKQAFIKNGLLKANLNGKSLQFMQESGEHWMQSVLTMGVLDSIKAMDADSNLIDKDGNPVTDEKKAASLLDMLEIKNGVLQMDGRVKYSTMSMGVAWNEGGKEMITQLIKKKIFDTMGNYDSNMQPEAMRHWYGKLTMMYRRYLVPMGLTRFRGFAYANKKYEALKDEEKFFSSALQEYEEGTYTTFTRFFLTSALPSIYKLNYKILSSNWSDMTDYQKNNIKKAVTEVMITAVILPLMRMAVAAAMDDDDELTYFLLLEIRRVESELASYRDPREQYRIFNSPIPSVRMLQNGTNFLSRLITPYNWDETYKSGSRKGMYKIQRDLEKLLPILNSRSIPYQEKYEYLVNMTD